MPERKKYHIPGLLKVSVAMLIAGTILVLSVSAVGNKDKEKINNININIIKTDGGTYISQNEIASVLKKSAGRDIKNQPVGSLDLALLESRLMKLKWVKRAELFIDNRNILQINIEQHKPVARVFTAGANSFFVSENNVVLPYRNIEAGRMPLFTGFTGDPKQLRRDDSLLIGDVVNIAQFLREDNFWMAQIDQVDITPSGTFEMIPKLGNQIIKFGDGADYKIKFSKLLAFYKQVLRRTGWERYAVIDLQFKDQVVAERRDAARVRSDSIAALRIMKNIIEDARKAELSDSSRIQLPDKPNNDKVRIPSPGTEIPQGPVSEVIPENAVPAVPSATPVPDTVSGLNNHGTGKAEIENLTTEKTDKREKRIPKAIMPPKNGN